MSKTTLLLILLFVAVVGVSVLPGAVDAIPSRVGILIGLIVGAAWIALALRLENDEGRRAWYGIIGAVAGLLLWGVSILIFEKVFGGGVWRGFALVAFPCAGFAVASRFNDAPTIGAVSGSSSTVIDARTPVASRFNDAPTIGAVSGNQRGETASGNILDTSTIIDGRIADVAQTGFLPGPYIIPQFILKELQYIADSSDALRRVRGRRGLDILQRLQKMPQIKVRIVYNDFPAIRDVDSKLVALGKQMSAKIVTNDFNLNKVASLQGVKVLNINDLAGALRSAVLPGEAINVCISKEGREPGQGVGYMEDGTMIIVDDGQRFMGKTIEVIVTNMLQAAAGRMVFARLREAPRDGAEGGAPLVKGV